MNIYRRIRRKFRINSSGVPYTGKGGTRESLAQLYGELGFNKGAEIGVHQAHYSKVLLEVNPQLELLCVDSWVPCPYIPSLQKQEKYYQRAVNCLVQYPKAKIMRMSSMEAAQQVPDKSLDFVYIDAEHDFNSVMKDIISWVPKVKMGGIVSGHDFTYGNNCFGVIVAVEAYTRAHNIQTWFVTDPSVGLDVSWFWVV